MGIKSILSRAPTRIDLAGGTVDIWPLYLFLENPVTLNLGIDLFAEARLELEPVRDGNQARVKLRSEDQNIETTLNWKDIATASAHPALDLHLRLIRYFVQRITPANSASMDCQFTLSTRAKSPAGAGLGGSSALSVAIIGALSAWQNGSVAPAEIGESLIQIVRDVETTVIQVPAGLQDYYGAMFGGLQSLRWKPAVHQRTSLDTTILSELEKRLLLFYSGQSRNSGINNWALFKNFIDKKEGVREKFSGITGATRTLESALVARDWKAAGKAIADEWEVRRTLASGISTPEMDQAFAAARKMAPVSGKVCGAGGGGCFFIYSPEDLSKGDLRPRIEAEFARTGIRPLAFRAVPHGLEVQVTHA